MGLAIRGYRDDCLEQQECWRVHDGVVYKPPLWYIISVMILTRLSLSFFPLHVLAFQKFPTHQSNQRLPGINFVEAGRSVLVRLETPDLSLWDAEEQYGEHVETALIFNFTISHDQSHLLLQDQPFLPLLDPNIPPRLHVPQTSESESDFNHKKVYNYATLPHFGLDYERTVNPQHEPAIDIYHYAPTLKLNLLGAGIAGYNTLLSSPEQRYIEVILKDENTCTGNPPTHKFVIQSVKVRKRDHDIHHILPEDVERCGRFSWRCVDFDSSPWYRYIYRQDFDEFGRIGSLRHEMYRRYWNLHYSLVFFRFWALVVAVGSFLVSPVVYAVYKRVLYVRRRYLAIRAEYDEDLRVRRECEDDMLLDDGDGVWDYIDAERYNEKRQHFPEKKEKQGDAGPVVMEKPLPPVPAAGGSGKVEDK
jgi:hypothetical protein